MPGCKHVLRALSAAFLALAMLVGMPAARADVPHCIDVTEMHSAKEPLSHDRHDTTHGACCNTMCAACVGMTTSSVATGEAELSSISFVVPTARLAGKTPSPGLEPPRPIS